MSRCAMRNWQLIAGLGLTLLCMVGPGCVRRRMTIRTSPAGAQVFVDDQEIGTTPCSASYVYYGTRKITVMKDGYKTETIFQRFNPPWYEFPPLDFVTENLIPREVRDERVVDVQLVPEQIVPQQKLVERAQSLRDAAATGTVTPLVNPSATTAGAVGPDPQLGLPGQGLPGGQPLPYESLPGPATSPPPQPLPSSGLPFGR
jgi:PEGA domain-containing protein